jgi:hypothetical protein
MKRNLFIVGIVASILMVSLVSAVWPFSATGNAIVDNTEVDDSGFEKCKDSDGGIFSEQYGEATKKGFFSTSTYSERCNKDKTKVREYYCSSKGNLKSTWLSCVGGCDNGACISPTPSCTVSNNGKTITDQYRKAFRSGCYNEGKYSSSGKNYVEYSCDETTGKITSIESTCTTRCGHSDGCWGSCLDEDPANNKDVAGKITLDGEAIVDVCNEAGTKVKQYACGTGSRLGYKKTIDWQSCGTNRECVTDAGGVGYCRDKYTSVVAGGSLETSMALLEDQFGDLQEELASLVSRIAVLEAA